MITYSSFHKRIFFIRRKSYDQNDNIFQQYLDRFDVVQKSLGWNDKDLLAFIDASWDPAFREMK